MLRDQLLDVSHTQYLLLYGGIQPSLPSGSSVGKLVRGISSCFPRVTVAVKSVHPALVVMDPTSGILTRLPDHAAAVRAAERLDSAVSRNLRGLSAVWWDISAMLGHVNESLIIGSVSCQCHYGDQINRKLVDTVLGSEWWRAWYGSLTRTHMTA